MELSYRELLQMGQTLLQEGRDLQSAHSIFHALLSDHFDQPEHAYYLLFLLANTELKLGHAGAAIYLLKQALAFQPAFIEATCNLGFIYKQLGYRDLAHDQFTELVAQIDAVSPPISDKEKSEYISNLASTYVANGTPQIALDLCNKALALNSTTEEALWNRGLAYLEIGDYAQGFEDVEYGERVIKRTGRNYHREQLPFWDGTPGQTVVVFGEQGIGDELMFASMLPDLMRDCTVIFDAHIRLQKMFQDSFPGMHVYGTREGPDVPWARYEKNIDAKLSIGSLGKFYRKSKADFPGTSYVKADFSVAAKYKDKLAKLSSRKKIGISWQGGIIKTNKRTRRIDMELLLPLLQCDADFISLQYNKDIGKKVHEFEQQHGVCLNHWQDMLDDYDETAGLVCNLDLIISVPQSVVHLAGGLGIPTVQLCPKQALWQMGPYGQNMPWYSCVENIWQDNNGEWEPVIQKAKEKLCSLLLNNTES
jgi:tetratricopeptide (TPR) repeat protein